MVNLKSLYAVALLVGHRSLNSIWVESYGETGSTHEPHILAKTSCLQLERDLDHQQCNIEPGFSLMSNALGKVSPK